jgi:serine/threonine-protein kinase SRPK3
VRFLGKLPDEWWSRWEGHSEEFEEDGSFKPDPDYPNQPAQLSRRDVVEQMRTTGLKRESAFGSAELDVLEELFGKMLKYRPSDRLGAAEVVRLMPRAWEKGVPM